MSPPRTAARYYKRSRFVTHLPTDRRYTAAHYWLREDEPGVWTVGLTRFATRMLGEIVEFGLSVAPGGALSLGQAVGFVEGFKAMSDVYSTVAGALVGGNDDLERDITLLDQDCYGRGWLFKARGAPDAASVDADGYAAILDTTIDAMLATRHDLAGDDQ